MQIVTPSLATIKLFSIKSHTEAVVMIVANAMSKGPAQCPIFAAGSEQPSLKSLFGQQPLETHESGSAIVWEGDPATDVFKVVEGSLRIFTIMADGRRIITGFVYPGDMLGISLNERYPYTAEASTR